MSHRISLRLSCDLPGLQSMSEAEIMSKLVFSELNSVAWTPVDLGNKRTMSLNLTVRRTFA